MSHFIGSLTGANAAKKASEQAAAAQQAEFTREANITNATADVNKTFDSQFTPDFYNQQKQNYINFAQPQLDQQYGDAQKQLTYSLARSGMLDSSARASEAAKLQQSYDTGAQLIGQTADQSANTIRNNVEGARSSLISSLAASGDTAGAVNNAAAQAATLSQTPSYSALGQLFGDTTSALAQQATLDKQNVLSGGSLGVSPYSLGLGSSNSAVRVSA